MDEQTLRFSPAYQGTLALVVTQQILLGIIVGMILDGGFCGAIFLSSLGAFWIGFITILVKRPRNPTKADIFLIKWGTFLLFMVAFILSLAILRLKIAMGAE